MVHLPVVKKTYGLGKTTMQVLLDLGPPRTRIPRSSAGPYRSPTHPLTHVGALLDAAALPGAPCFCSGDG
jgi:hypothetical protein